MDRFRGSAWAAPASLFAAVLLAWSNHFGNGFHFDDIHSIIRNPSIRSLANWPQFFRDGATMSVDAVNASYRPLLVTSLALDYRLGGGPRPFWFHFSTFFWYLVLLASFYWLALRVFERGGPGVSNRWLALVAVGAFGLHPASAETVNYIVQRADVYVALGIVAGIVVYDRFPRARRYGGWLLPPAAGLLAKPTGLIFAPMLLVWVLLIGRRPGASRLRATLWAVPAFGLCAAGLRLLQAMTPASFSASDAFHPAREYWLTQPYVSLRYFHSFFLPTRLSADTDLTPFRDWNGAAVAGCVFVALAIGAAVAAGRVRRWQPAAFGLWWFLLGLVPTALFPLAEVENDHRMFLPFIGLSMAVVWTAARIAGGSRVRDQVLTGVAVVWLVVLAWGTHQRNEVWRTEESLWRDVTEKSPNNARGWVNYGNALLLKGEPAPAWNAFQRSAAIRPNNPLLEVNLARTAEALGQGDGEIEAHFRKARMLSGLDGQPYTYYGKWLRSRGRTLEAMELLNQAANLSPRDLDCRYALIEIYAEKREWDRLSETASQTLSLVPGDPTAARMAKLAERKAARLAAAEHLIAVEPTAEHYLSLAAIYREDARYEASVRAARRAIDLRPGFAEAYEELAVAYREAGNWRDATSAAREALKIKP